MFTYKVYFIDGSTPAIVKLDYTSIQDIMKLLEYPAKYLRLGNHIFATSHIKYIECLEK